MRMSLCAIGMPVSGRRSPFATPLVGAAPLREARRLVDRDEGVEIAVAPGDALEGRAA